ncbi:DoxX family protein [Parapedobacter tibetensis]|uniref:DoxX family protein n=1 Tax=Parapedobacter tibetensis TaxID=2972951 RepID=UPI00214D70E1|nr:DoxX family protein [Parapedobacter tibetensis]
MKLIQRIEYWGDTHHPRWLDVLRIALGIIIFLKGVTFLADTTSLRRLIEETHIIYTWGAVHYIAFSHLVGGILIAIGLITRVAIGFQLPILFGAVFFVNITRGLTFLNSELWISIIVLTLLVVFFVIGSGPYSLDHQMRERKNR